jgi:glycosyltransferase involved in cell wall biosynthesis
MESSGGVDQNRFMTRRRVLFIQHAGALGGSCVSLMYLLRALNRARYEPVVALIRPNPEVENYYRTAGFETLNWPGIETFEHTTAAWTKLHAPLTWSLLFRAFRRRRTSQARTLELVRAVKPDLVHLNSVVLLWPARALQAAGVPFVWHVREAPVHGWTGLRFRLLSHALRTLGREIVFISEADKRAWRTDGRGVVVHNFVDFADYAPERPARAEGESSTPATGRRCVIYVGAFQRIKGFETLLHALNIVRAVFPDVLCLMPAVQLGPPTSWRGRIARRILPLFGSGAPVQIGVGLIQRLGLTEHVRLLPFVHEMAPLLRQAEFLVFPSIRPHFARPVIEAAAAGRPSIGSNLDGVAELIRHGETGILVPPMSAQALADAMIDLLRHPEKTRRLGERAREVAHVAFSSANQVTKIEAIYQRVLAPAPAA